MSKTEFLEPSRVMRPDAKTDGLVLGALFCLCSLGIWLLSPSHTKSPTPSAHEMLPMLVEESAQLETVDLSEMASQPADLQKLFQFPLLPSANQSSAPAFERSWGNFELPTKQRKTGGAFITLLGDDLNTAMFRKSTPGRESKRIHLGMWREQNVQSQSEGTELLLKKDADNFTMSEVQTLQDYGYGRYEVIMRPAKGSGSVSSFFTYTGAHRNMPHDEIDIEFLGANPTQVEFNYFRNGQRGNAVVYDLPFDATADEHLYAFEWYPDKIIWLVDGEVYHRTATDETGIPRQPGRIIINLWTGIERLEAWHGPAMFGNQTSASYSCISYTPLGEVSRSCSDYYKLPSAD